jgi:protein ImuB
MRIACVHVPQFALQSLGRIDPTLRGAAVAVVGAGLEPAAGVRSSLALHSPIVLACSRAAWAAGVRLGMTATAARFVSPDVRVVSADGGLERETVRAIADALLGVSAVVDTGGRVGASAAHLAMYCEVPGKTRGTTFGSRVLDALDSLGLAGRVGIADDRFTAWVAASHSAEGSAREDRGVVSVPRGGSAAFLAPRPLSLLAITPEVQHMLEALGVRTLGEFAALPAPSVSRPLEADYQALARGDSGSVLRPYAPDAPIREELVVRHEGSLFGGAAAVATLAERVAVRLAGRGRGASRLELTILGERGERVVPLTAGAATSADALAERIAPHIAEAPGAVNRLRVVVAGEAIAEVAAVASGAGAGLSAGALAVAAMAGAAGAPGAGMTDGTTGRMADGTTGATIDALSAALSAAGARRSRSLGELGDSEALVGPDSLPWQLSAPSTLRAERRDAHRRTRRARQRRRTVTLAQPPLFGQLDG